MNSLKNQERRDALSQLSRSWLSDACLSTVSFSPSLSLSGIFGRKRKRATTCCAVNNIERGNAMDLSITTRDSYSAYVFMSRRNLVEWDARACVRACVRGRTQQVSISALGGVALGGCAVSKNKRERCDARRNASCV